MKKHPFLSVDFHSTVKLTTPESKKLKLWLDWSGLVLGQLIKEGLFPHIKSQILENVHISLLICGDSRIRKLNHDHRQKNKVTDVLSFPSSEGLRGKGASSHIQEGHLFLGDLAICLPQARRQARAFSIGVWDEFIHLFFHGLLHLSGYDHELSLSEEKLMQTWEDRAVELFSAIKKRKGA